VRERARERETESEREREKGTEYLRLCLAEETFEVLMGYIN